MGHPASRWRRGQRSTVAEGSLSSNNRPADNNGARSRQQSRQHHHCCHRGRRADARRRTDSHRSLPRDDPNADRIRPRPLDRCGGPKLDRFLRLACRERYRRGPRCLDTAPVERSDRGPDHQAQARQAPDLRQCKDRSPSGKITWSGLNGGECHRDCVRTPFGCQSGGPDPMPIDTRITSIAGVPRQ